MIGVDVGIDGFHQLQIQFLDELDVAIHAVEYRVDDEGLAALPAGEQIAVG